MAADLNELEAIKRLKYRYVRSLDLKLWDELEQCLTEDCHSAYGDGQFMRGFRTFSENNARAAIAYVWPARFGHITVNSLGGSNCGLIPKLAAPCSMRPSGNFPVTA